jgi:3-hydroxyacyl-CoA dehydrogenase/enoyl-CoA hydratase/3-hydroxybutyryl-CoA epimerase
MQMPELELKHWKLDSDAQQITWLVFDKADSTVNVLSAEVLSELKRAIEHLKQNRPRALIIKSAKAAGFCAGADVEEFRHIRNRDQALDHMNVAQQVFDQLENLLCPSLCLIHGFCLGGGLELALACDYRIASESESTRIGLPEVKLGIHPGFAGSVRLTRLIGAPSAMKIILSGRALSAIEAAGLGIISHALPDRLLESAATTFIMNPPGRAKAHRWRGMTNNAIVRPILAHILRSDLKRRIREEHYPAPYAQLEVWSRYGGSRKKMKRKEAESVADLIMTPTAQNLIRLFFLRDELKAFGKESDFKPSHIHVVGAGLMGGDIAAWCALKGMNVTLQDRDSEAIALAFHRAHRFFWKKLKDNRLVQQAHDRLTADKAGYGISCAELVIEAIDENLVAKQELFALLEQQAKSTAILATNTSSLRIEKIAQCLQEPSRLVGMHFFNPVAQMQLVEIIHSEDTNPDYVKDVAACVTKLGKLPLSVNSSPGFLVNRVLMPYLLEAITLYEEGISGPVIDEAARSFGMPIGPMELADTVGLDVCLQVAESLSTELGNDIPELLRTMVDRGSLGKKSGEGFYRYFRGKSRVQKVNRVPDDLQDRLLLRLINESMQCLHEGVIEEPDLLDAGIVFGTGFAPFHGGPMQYAASLGTNHIRNLLKKYETLLGGRFRASPGW